MLCCVVLTKWNLVIVWGLALGPVLLLLIPRVPGSVLPAGRAVQQLGVACIPSFLRVVARGLFWALHVEAWLLLLRAGLVVAAAAARGVLPYGQQPVSQE